MKEQKFKTMWVTKAFFKDGACLKYDPSDDFAHSGQVEYMLEKLNDETLQFVRSQGIIINKKEVLYIDFEEIKVVDTD